MHGSGSVAQEAHFPHMSLQKCSQALRRLIVVRSVTCMKAPALLYACFDHDAPASLRPSVNVLYFSAQPIVISLSLFVLTRYNSFPICPVLHARRLIGCGSKSGLDGPRTPLTKHLTSQPQYGRGTGVVSHVRSTMENGLGCPIVLPRQRFTD